MKDIITKINESKEGISKDNILAIMCAVKTLLNDNANYSLEIKTKKINPDMSQKDIFDAAQIIIDQKIWEIK